MSYGCKTCIVRNEKALEHCKGCSENKGINPRLPESQRKQVGLMPENRDVIILI